MVTKLLAREKRQQMKLTSLEVLASLDLQPTNAVLQQLTATQTIVIRSSNRPVVVRICPSNGVRYNPTEVIMTVREQFVEIFTKPIETSSANTHLPWGAEQPTAMQPN